MPFTQEIVLRQIKSNIKEMMSVYRERQEF